MLPRRNGSKLWAKYYKGVEAAHAVGKKRGWSHSADDELSKVVNAVRSATNFDPSGGRAAKRRAAAEVEVGPVGPA